MSVLQKDTLEITTNVGCAIDCSYCPQEVLVHRYGNQKRFMDEHDFKLLLLGVSRTTAIHFSGMAEPFLNDGSASSMIRLAHDAGHVVSVFTTTVGMSDSDWPNLSGIPFYDFVVHLPSEENKENIPLTTKLLGNLQWIKHNVTNAKFLCFGTPPNVVGALIGNERLKRIKIKPRAGLVAQSQRHAGPIECGRSIERNVVLPNGTVLLCCQDYGMRHVLGNLRSNTLGGIRNGDEMLKVRDGMKDDTKDILCRTCELAAHRNP